MCATLRRLLKTVQVPLVFSSRMCGRSRCVLAPAEIAKEANVPETKFEDAEKYNPVANMGPGRYSPIIYHQRDAKPGLRAMKWGLIPSFTKPTAKPDHFVMFNARSENLMERPAYRRLVNTRRCVVLYNGYYEWKQLNKREKQPYYLYHASGEPIKLAGLYDHWTNESGDEMFTYTVVTTDIASQLRWLHTRMPVILHDQGAVDRWLSDAPFDQVRDLLHPYEHQDLESHPVDRKVGSTRVQDEDCWQKINLRQGGDIKSFFSKAKELKQETNVDLKKEPTATGGKRSGVATSPSPVKKRKGPLDAFFKKEL